MKNQNQCPCCRDRLLRQIGRGKIYWFCAYCHQTMPVVTRTLKTEIS
jgi:ribosomal protein L37AE/L43A